MSARSDARDRWEESGGLDWEADEDGHAVHGGKVIFDDVPLGNGDKVILSVDTGLDDRGAIVILGLSMNKPINARRLKGIPLGSVRNECQRIIAAEPEWQERYGRAHLHNESADDVDPRKSTLNKLSTLGITDRKSPVFLELVAEVVRDARAHGTGGWNAVAGALANSDGTPVSRATAQRYMKRARESGYELGELLRSTDIAASIKINRKVH